MNYYERNFLHHLAQDEENAALRAQLIFFPETKEEQLMEPYHPIIWAVPTYIGEDRLVNYFDIWVDKVWDSWCGPDLHTR